MIISKIAKTIGVSAQIRTPDIADIVAQGYRSVICNRPDDEEQGQPSSATIADAVKKAGLEFAYVPAISGALTGENVKAMAEALDELQAPVLAYCRSGARSAKLIELAKAATEQANPVKSSSYNFVIVGGGSAGIAAAASILKRKPKVSLTIVEPSEEHFYQPGWTMVGAGVFSPEFTRREESKLIPKGADWIKSSVATFEPEENKISLCDGSRIGYDILIVCPGIKLDWQAIPGLADTLGKNGVTSNYGYSLAPYTNRLIKELDSGRALFTQPPMPIKCAGAPQKAMYLSCNHWEREDKLNGIDVQFHNAGGVLFGVEAYVPALSEYVERYGINLNFQSNLAAIDGEKKIATFKQKTGDKTELVELEFDMIHVVPPQVAPDFIRSSPLAAANGFVEVDDATLRHQRYANIFSLGDACSAPNAKTMAAARKQAPVVAVNALAALDGKEPVADYDGYGSCPLTVERGKIVLAEFGYGGKLLPSFPNWLVDGTRPSRLSWLLKDTLLPPVYWHGMLKGREWMAQPHKIDVS